MSPGIDWVFDPANPVVRPGSIHPGLDDGLAGAAHVLPCADGYRMYYWGRGTAGNVILMAESPAGRPNDWAPRGGVLLGRQAGTVHNAEGPSFPFVVPLGGDFWLMFVCSWGARRPDGTLANTTALAVSDDSGLTWRYADEKPAIALDRPYDRSATGSVCVVRANGEWRMYYTAIAGWRDRPAGVRTGHGDRIPSIGIALAVSRDGMSWDKPFDDWVVRPREFEAEPYEYINSKPFVIRDGDRWRMWISTFGHAYRVRSLVSEDGIVWERVPSGPDGDLGIGAAGTFDDVQRSYACVVKERDVYRLWYTGNRFGATGMGYAEGRGTPPSR